MGRLRVRASISKPAAGGEPAGLLPRLPWPALASVGGLAAWRAWFGEERERLQLGVGQD